MAQSPHDPPEPFVADAGDFVWAKFKALWSVIHSGLVQRVVVASSDKAYSWGDEIGVGKANCDGCGSKWDATQTAPVGSFAANRFGLYDMVGNVFEWVEDCSHNNNDGAPTDGSAWMSGGCAEHGLRGGSWFSTPYFVSTSARSRFEPDYRSNSVGFRLIREISP